MSAVLLCVTASAVCYEAEDFREIVSRAKSQVFPALIFVKPIVEDYTRGEKTQQEVFGSGVIISPDGYAVTNHHVVDNALTINCVLHDKRQVKVTLVGSDQDTDLALLKLPSLDGGQVYPHARFDTSETMHTGDFVMALGSPFGFQRSISLGIISNAQRYLGFDSDFKYNTWIQTDAAINPGNSGGPLINTRGMIIGINTLGVGGTGLGFSIPASTVEDTVRRLKQDGRVRRAYTGLLLQALKDFHSNTFIESEHGVLVAGVEENSPAAHAGMRAGDILLRIAGTPLEGTYAERLPECWNRLSNLTIGEPVTASVQRGTEVVSITLTPEQKGLMEGEDFDCRRWNMTVKEISKYATPRLHYIQPKGVYIQGIKYGGNASNSGLMRRDIITRMDKQPVVSIDDIKRLYEQILTDQQREKKVVLEVLRGGLVRWIVLDYRRDFDEE